MAEPLRTVIWEPEFEQDFAKVRAKARRVEDFVDAAEWILSRDPCQGVQIPLTHTWILNSRPHTHRLRPVTLYYAFDDDEVHFLAVEFSR